MKYWNHKSNKLALFCLIAVMKHYNISRDEMNNVVERGVIKEYYAEPRKVLGLVLHDCGYTASEIGKLLELSAGHLSVQWSRLRKTNQFIVLLSAELAETAKQLYAKQVDKQKQK